MLLTNSLTVSSPAFLRDTFYLVKNSGLTVLFFQDLKNLYLLLRLSSKFLRRNLLSFESLFLSNPLLLSSCGSLQKFFFVLRFQKFDYDVSGCKALKMYSI